MTTIPRLIAALGVATSALLSGCNLDEDVTVAPNAPGGYNIYSFPVGVKLCDNGVNGRGISCSVDSVNGTIDILAAVTVVALFDPVIVEVPASSEISGEVFRCDPFLGSELCSSIGPLKVTQGLASVPVDLNTQLHAEPGMQLAILDFPPFPGKTAPPGKYRFRLFWNQPAQTIKGIFTVKVETGGTTYYAPFLPCATDFADVPAVPASATLSAAQILSLVTKMTPCNHKAYDYGGGGGPPPGAAANYQGLWWVPNGAENYWGINLAHQGDQVFATWYTYDTSGNPWWLSMLANKTAASTYSGDINVDAGPPFNAYVGKGKPDKVGTGTLTFSDAGSGTFSYTVAGGGGSASQSKTITRYVLDAGSAPPACAYTVATPNFAGATNYQDLWWVAGGAEDGWGINFAHQGKLLFATWYTYGTDRAPLWLSVLATQVGATNVYTGTLYRTSGPRYDAYDVAQAKQEQIGTATFTFADGNHAQFDYSTTGIGGLPVVSQSKQITRFAFAASGGTLCQ